MADSERRTIGRYRLYQEFASGGMAALHWGRLAGEAGFSRLVAIKRLHPQFAKDDEFVKMFVDEARVSGRIQHPNVVPVLDVVRDNEELFLVMDYVHGESLSRLIKLARAGGGKVPPPIAAKLVADLLQGLHAAHEARGEAGKPLDIVHRDVSPQNLLVGIDGVGRVVDFGIAKAVGRLQSTAEGSMKGKLGYFSPEQLQNKADRRTDVFAAAVVLWETLMARRLFVGDTQWDIVQSVLHQQIDDPAVVDDAIPGALGQVVLRGLDRNVEQRFQTAREMLHALEQSIQVASTSQVSDWVLGLAGAELDKKRAALAQSEELEDLLPPPSIGRPTGKPAAPPEDVPTKVESPARKPREPRASVVEVEVDSAAPSQTSPRLEAERAPLSVVSPSRLMRRKATTQLKVVAGLGVLLGLGGVGFASWSLLRERAPSAADGPSSVTAAPPTPSATAEPSSSPSVSASVVLSGSASSAPPSAPASQTPSAKPPSAANPASIPPSAAARVTCFTASNEGILCGSVCTLVGTDPVNCGACGKVCGAGEACLRGTCGGCPPLLTACSGRCVDTLVNGAHCGKCGNDCVVKGKHRCSMGDCAD